MEFVVHRPRDVPLDIVDTGPQGSPPGATNGVKPFLMVTFRCANAYQRVYRAADGSHYLARCPKCGKSVRFLVGKGGSDQRAFDVSCG
jgi:phage FluMu protein Com